MRPSELICAAIARAKAVRAAAADWEVQETTKGWVRSITASDEGEIGAWEKEIEDLRRLRHRAQARICVLHDAIDRARWR